MPALEQTNRKRRFYRQTFVVKDKGEILYKHTLLVNPQEMSVTEPPRVSVQQTLGGAYVANFGEGLHQITISGTTGYHARTNAEGRITDGYMEIQDFRNKIYRDFIKSPSTELELFWYNWEDQEFYKVIPHSFRLMRNKSEPTLYRYELPMTAVEKIGLGASKKQNKNDIDQVNLISTGASIAKAISGISEVIHTLNGGRA